MRRFLLVLVAAVFVAACGTVPATQPPPVTAPASDHGNIEATQPGPVTAPHCGIERWPVKTGTDPGAAKVDLTTVVPATIQQLAAITASAVLPQAARAPTTDAAGHVVEQTVYQVQATLTAFKQEADSDFHLVLTQTDSQGTTRTMIVEIPDPSCVGGGSPFLPGITAARAAFTQAMVKPTTNLSAFTHVSVPVTVTGVGFFDPEHGQTGGLVLQGGQVTIEIHPVTGIKFGSGS